MSSPMTDYQTQQLADLVEARYRSMYPDAWAAIIARAERQRAAIQQIAQRNRAARQRTAARREDNHDPDS